MTSRATGVALDLIEKLRLLHFCAARHGQSPDLAANAVDAFLRSYRRAYDKLLPAFPRFVGDTPVEHAGEVAASWHELCVAIAAKRYHVLQHAAGEYLTTADEHEFAAGDLDLAEVAEELAELPASPPDKLRAGVQTEAAKRQRESSEADAQRELASEMRIARAKEWRRDLANRLRVQTSGKPSSGRSATSDTKRARMTKDEVRTKTWGAIGHKIGNPTATAAECAEAVGMPQSTLSGRPEWREWAPRIADASAVERQTMRREWDSRIGTHVITDSDTDT